GETLIQLADGAGTRRIDDLVGRDGFRVNAWNRESSTLEARLVQRAFATGCRPVFELTTAFGRNSIKATANHRFLAVDGWRRLDEFKSGDRIAQVGAWAQIAAIEPAGEEEAYDLTLEGLPDFVASDMLVHNSPQQGAALH